MKKYNLVLATIMVALITLFGQTAEAQYESTPCNQCPQILQTVKRDACFTQCLKTAPPKPKPLDPTSPTSTTKPKATGTGTAPLPPPKECGESEAADADGNCICVSGFERFPVKDGPCVPVCTEGQIRNAEGRCVDCSPKVETDPCCEALAARIEVLDKEAKAERATLAAAINQIFWMLAVCILLLLVLLGWRIADGRGPTTGRAPTTK